MLCVVSVCGSKRHYISASCSPHASHAALPCPARHRRNIIYGMEEEDGVPPELVPSQEDVEQAAR